MLPTGIAETKSKRGPSPAAANENAKEEDGTGVEDDDDPSESGHKRTLGRYLACPFYKHNASLHMVCVRFRLKRVRDVKQHLNRCHSRHMQCPVCGSVFKDSPALESHIRMRKCREPPGGFRIQGVTAKQGKLLSRRVKRKIGEVSQWYDIWRILFPGSDRPQSPYLINELDEAVNTVRDTWKRQGGDIVNSVLIKGLANAAMGKNTAGNDSCSHAATHKHVMEMSQCVLDELIRRIQLDSQKIMGPPPSFSNTGKDEQVSENEDQDLSQSLDVEPNQKQLWLHPVSTRAGQELDSRTDDTSQVEAVETDQKPPFVGPCIWEGTSSSDISDSSIETYGTSPEPDIQPETPLLVWMTAGLPGFTENSLSTFQTPTGGGFSTGAWFPVEEPWMGKLSASPELSCGGMSMSAFPACSRESSSSWAPTPGQVNPFIVTEGMPPEESPEGAINYSEMSELLQQGPVPWE